jgi:hypothetical protein
MSSLKYVLCGALLSSLAACSSHPAPQQDAAAGANPAKSSTAIPASNPLAPMLNTRNRAKAVEKDLKAHDAAERKALKDAQQ